MREHRRYTEPESLAPELVLNNLPIEGNGLDHRVPRQPCRGPEFMLFRDEFGLFCKFYIQLVRSCFSCLRPFRELVQEKRADRELHVPDKKPEYAQFGQVSILKY